MEKNKAIEAKKNKPVITLRQLENRSIVARDGEPATLYQITWRCFHDRSQSAIEAAEAGDFSLIDVLIPEVNLLIENFVQHRLYLTRERAIIKDPDGPEARQRKELLEYANRQYLANMAESRKQKRLSKEGVVNKIPA